MLVLSILLYYKTSFLITFFFLWSLIFLLKTHIDLHNQNFFFPQFKSFGGVWEEESRCNDAENESKSQM